MFFARPKVLNDPFDTSEKFILPYSHFCEKIGWKNESAEAFGRHGIFCMSRGDDNERGPKNRHLWSLYASNYSGFVVEFNEQLLADYFSSKFIMMEDVNYVDTPFNLDDDYSAFSLDSLGNKTYTVGYCFEEDQEHRLDHLFRYLHLHKEKGVWEVEHECRAIIGNIVSKNCQVVGDVGYYLEIPSNSIKSLYIGYKMKATYRKRLARIARTLNCPVFSVEPMIIDQKWDMDILQL